MVKTTIRNRPSTVLLDRESPDNYCTTRPWPARTVSLLGGEDSTTAEQSAALELDGGNWYSPSSRSGRPHYSAQHGHPSLSSANHAVKVLVGPDLSDEDEQSESPPS